mmetsp:Transcript_19955/g.43541  ORF Transcript_19955/g.43541 Transcript_19955/m.43541 type:complete len:204 (+) Transcript_19955:1457-2068(+)
MDSIPSGEVNVRGVQQRLGIPRLEDGEVLQRGGNLRHHTGHPRARQKRQGEALEHRVLVHGLLHHVGIAEDIKDHGEDLEQQLPLRERQAVRILGYGRKVIQVRKERRRIHLRMGWQEPEARCSAEHIASEGRRKSLHEGLDWPGLEGLAVFESLKLRSPQLLHNDACDVVLQCHARLCMLSRCHGFRRFPPGRWTPSISRHP